MFEFSQNTISGYLEYISDHDLYAGVVGNIRSGSLCL